jgi:hypothetical protein
MVIISLSGDDDHVLDRTRVSGYSRSRGVDDQIVSGNRKDTLIVGTRWPNERVPVNGLPSLQVGVMVATTESNGASAGMLGLAG